MQAVRPLAASSLQLVGSSTFPLATKNTAATYRLLHCSYESECLALADSLLYFSP
jgi:hypothetical protein